MDKRDSELIIALATGATSTEAARRSGYSLKTVHRRRANSEFMRQVSDARGELVKRAAGRLAGAAEDAIETLKTLLKAESESVRLSAARSILDACVRFRDACELEDRVRELESKLGEDSL